MLGGEKRRLRRVVLEPAALAGAPGSGDVSSLDPGHPGPARTPEKNQRFIWSTACSPSDGPEVSPDCKLYIKGLPMGADDLYLYKVFSPWARLLEAVALSKGNYTIGFVTCLTEAEAVECITNVNGVPLTDGTTLQVSVKTSKH